MSRLAIELRESRRFQQGLLHKRQPPGYQPAIILKEIWLHISFTDRRAEGAVCIYFLYGENHSLTPLLQPHWGFWSREITWLSPPLLVDAEHSPCFNSSASGNDPEAAHAQLPRQPPPPPLQKHLLTYSPAAGEVHTRALFFYFSPLLLSLLLSYSRFVQNRGMCRSRTWSRPSAACRVHLTYTLYNQWQKSRHQSSLSTLTSSLFFKLKTYL